MEIFRKAAVVRLRSHRGKYVVADEDQESVQQDRRGTSKNARWTVEIIPTSTVIRLQSCYGKYLTASNLPFLLGATGNKVLQTSPEKLDSSVEWEPIEEGGRVKLKTNYGQYLRANRGLPPWRNSVTHDIPSRTVTRDWILWDVDVLQLQNVHDDEDYDYTSSNFSPIELDDSYDMTDLPSKSEGRLIYYEIGDEDGNIDEVVGERWLTFNGSELEELKERLEEETGMEELRLCSRNPLNGNLYPLQLHLPPNNTTMHVIVVPSSSHEIEK